MVTRFPNPPDTGTPLAVTRPSGAARELLALRRSAGKATLGEPGPSPQALDDLLRVGARVADHRRVEPWRFIVFTGPARDAFGAVLAEIRASREPEVDAAALQEERARALRAPVVVAVVSSPDPAHKTPVWEQELSTGAVCHQLCLAAMADDWGAVWLTEWPAYDGQVARRLGLAAGERIAGFVHIGTPTADAPERPRPDMAAKVTHWQP